MSSVLFACDLDNTLLYSYKHRKPGDLCVEMIHEKEQGFMTSPTVALLRELQGQIQIVPVTTRSVAQYKRIAWPAGVAPEYAVVANGAILLRNGEIDPLWQEGSEAAVAPHRMELRSLAPEFEDKDRFLRCRIVDDAYLFAYCGHNVSPAECAEAYKSHTRLSVVCSGQKVYFFPPEINKGNAVRRLKSLLHPSVTIAAGDSIIDIPMLNEANLAIIPAGLQSNAVSVPYVRASREVESFSEFVLETVLASV